MKNPTVAEIEVAQVKLPLTTPVRLGKTEITHRDYVALRLVLSDGAEGFAYGYERGLPLASICAFAAKHYLGQPASERNLINRTARGALPASYATMIRGVSLCDIALWDAWCVSNSVPLWAVLGATRRTLPIMPIVGYGMDADTAARQTSDLARSGYRTIKCMIDGTDFSQDSRLIKAVAGALIEGARFGIDAHWSWTSVDQAMPWCVLAENLGAAFIEDPFSPVQHQAIVELSRRIHVPLAVGEDVTDIFGILGLTSSAGILRVDASVCGGISSTIEAIALAHAHGRPVIPHVFLGLHAQFGFAYDIVRCCEIMAPSVAADPIDQFFVEPPVIEQGELVASSKPGAGLALDWDRLVPFMVTRERLKESVPDELADTKV